MRRPHYWRRAGAASAPSNILVFDTETWHGDRARVEGGEVQTLRLGHVLCYRLERGRRTRVREAFFKDHDTFWRIVADRLDPRRPLWVVAHNLPFDLGVVGGWNVALSSRCEWERVCVGSGITYFQGLLDGRPCRFLDLCNYHHCSLAAVGRSVGLPKMVMPDQSAPDRDWEVYCRNDVEITAAALDQLIDFARTEELGPWQPTIAGLAFSAYRSRFLYPKVLVHDVRPVLELERAAYYGGLVEPAFIGEVPSSPVSETDVCSMYPAVCQGDLPRRLEGYCDRLTVPDLRRISRNYQCIADVRLGTRTEPFPVKLPGGTYHPVGDYRTTLPDPELRHALRAGVVKGVYRVAWYSAAPIFRDYMDHFLKLKVAAHAGGDEAREAMAKMMLNSLYGKTGQLAHRWREWSAETFRFLESHYRLAPMSLEPYLDGLPVTYSAQAYCHLPGVPDPLPVRELWGRLEVQCPNGESRESCPAVAATVTSYARRLLRDLQRVAGVGEWFYSDTDSVWVSETGRERLGGDGRIAEGVPGKLSVKGAHSRMVVYGPKDYETERVRRLKGVRPAAVPLEGGRWMQLQFPGALTQLADARPDGVFVRHVVKRLKREVTRCVVLPSGATRPLKFPEECPVKVD